MSRDNRKDKDLREVEIIPNYLNNPLGSVLISFGKTKVICTVMVEENVPPWIANDDNNQQGWLTANYGMLPGSGDSRIQRETHGARGRTKEIQRLIGRSIRAAIDLDKLSGFTIWVDCDVIQADGGTRTASITGAWVALKLAINELLKNKKIEKDPIFKQVAAVSIGLKDGKVLSDLCYEEDSSADVDMNIVMDNHGNLIELQATGEGGVFNRKQMDEMLDAAESCIKELFVIQNSAISKD